MTLCAILLFALLSIAGQVRQVRQLPQVRQIRQAPRAMATFKKPGAGQEVVGGGCRNDGKGTFGAAFPNAPDAKRPFLTFSIGPGTFMAKESHASLAPYHGPGTYTDVLSSGNAGNAGGPAGLANAFAGLATVTVNAGGKSGTLTTNDGKVSATWDCGALPQ